MTDKQHLIDLLAGRHLFLSSLHYTRFVQLYDTIEELPFFCGGLIKCAFVAAWIQNFHDSFLEDLTIASESGCQDTSRLQELLRGRLPSLSPGRKDGLRNGSGLSGASRTDSVRQLSVAALPYLGSHRGQRAGRQRDYRPPGQGRRTGRMSAANSSLYRKKQGCSPVFFHTSLSMITDRKRKV